MKHYVCTGDCGAEASAPGTCQMEECTHYGMALKECSCEDGAHAEMEEESSEEEATE